MHYITNKGVKIHYEVEGEGPPLVMLHGLFGNVVDWYDFEYVNKLKDDYQLILIDQRGHGKSDKPHDSEEFTAKLFADDVVAVLEELAIDEFNVYGFSMGAWFVFALAYYYPSKLLSIIIADGLPMPGNKGGFQELIGSLDEVVATWDEITDSHKIRILANDRKTMLLLADARDREIGRVVEQVDEVIGLLNVPCLILIREIEQSETQLKLEKISKLIQGAELFSLDGFTHLDVLTRSDITLPIIRDFLAKANKV